MFNGEGNANGFSIVSSNPLSSEGEIIGGYSRSAANIYTPLLRPDVFIPIFWIDRTATIDGASATKFLEYGKLLGTIERVAHLGIYCGAGVAVIGFLLAVITRTRQRRRGRQRHKQKQEKMSGSGEENQQGVIDIEMPIANPLQRGAGRNSDVTEF